MPTLLLQKPHSTSKACGHVVCLQRRLVSWQEGDIDYLMREGHTIQQRLRLTRIHMDDGQRTLRTFSKLMFQARYEQPCMCFLLKAKARHFPLTAQYVPVISN